MRYSKYAVFFLGGAVLCSRFLPGTLATVIEAINIVIVVLSIFIPHLF